MDPPSGFEQRFGSRMYKLKKSLYSLKQSPRAWFEKFIRFAKKQSYNQAQTHHTMFIKHSGDGRVTFLIVYVDDIILTGDDLKEMNLLKASLASEFEIKDLGSIAQILSWSGSGSVQGSYCSFTAKIYPRPSQGDGDE